MKLSLICEAHYETDLAKRIIESIAKAHGTSDFETLREQVFTAKFLSDDAKIEEKDRTAAYKAELLVDAEKGQYKLSDKAFELARGGRQRQQGLTGRIMGGAPGFSSMVHGVSQLKGAMRGGK